MNILIVDDDVLIRNWLSILIGQLKQDIHLLEAGNGLDALEVCKAHKINLVITDIVMPLMDGMELISILKEDFPLVRVAVLSSYDNFEYTRASLKAGALDYIPKAEIKIEDISNLVDKVRKDIALEQNFSHAIVNHGEIEHRTMLFGDYLQKKTDDDAFLNHFLPTITREQLNVTAFRVGEEYLDENIKQQIIALTERCFQNQFYSSVALYTGSDFIVLYNAKSSILEHQKEEYLKLISLLDQSFGKYMATNILKSVNIGVQSSDSLKETIHQSMDMMEVMIYYQATMKELTQKKSHTHNSTNFIIELKTLLDMYKYDQAVAVIKKELDLAHDGYLLPHAIKRLTASSMNVLLMFALMLQENHGKIDLLNGYLYNVSTIKNKGDMTELLDLFCQDYLALIDGGETDYSKPVRLAIIYIESHYAKKILLDDVAEAIYYNSSYISQVFKKEVGVSFSDYLEKVRIIKAKELLKDTNKSISEIAEYVGFANQNYFARIFKKEVGISPSKFHHHQ